MPSGLPVPFTVCNLAPDGSAVAGSAVLTKTTVSTLPRAIGHTGFTLRDSPLRNNLSEGGGATSWCACQDTIWVGSNTSYGTVP